MPCRCRAWQEEPCQPGKGHAGTGFCGELPYAIQCRCCNVHLSPGTRHWLLQVSALKPDRFEPKIIKQEPDYLYVEYKVGPTSGLHCFLGLRGQQQRLLRLETHK